MTNVHITMKSSNVKTGPIPVSTTTADTCPPACPFNNSNAGGCYAESGPLKLHWKKVTEGNRGTYWDDFCNTIADLPKGQLWRHNQAGDLPGDGQTINQAELGQLVESNEGRRGFTYTHYPMDSAENREAVTTANEAGFTVNLSGNDLDHADALADLGIAPVVTVLPADQVENTVTAKGRKVVVCPAAIKDGISCATCQLCARQRDVIIGFPAHGSSKKKADAIAKGAA